MYATEQYARQLLATRRVLHTDNNDKYEYVTGESQPYTSHR